MMHEEFAQKRGQVQLLTDDARKELRLKQLIVEHFIPLSEAEKLKQRAYTNPVRLLKSLIGTCFAEDCDVMNVEHRRQGYGNSLRLLKTIL